MYPDWAANAIVAAVTAVAVATCVLIHYEGLLLLSRRLMSRHEANPRRKVLYGVVGALCLHVLEIWVFGLCYLGLLGLDGTGQVQGADPLGWADAVYLSAMTYTTVGFGDVAPVGAIRFLAGTEALVGFVMITWTASFMFLEMERFWRR